VKVSLVLCFVISLVYLPSANYPAVLYRSIFLSHNSPGLAQLGLNTPNNFHSPVSVWPIISAATLGLALPSIIPSQMDCNHHLTILLAFTVTIILPSYLRLPSPWSYHPTCVYNILQWYIIQCNVQTQVIYRWHTYTLPYLLSAIASLGHSVHNNNFWPEGLTFHQQPHSITLSLPASQVNINKQEKPNNDNIWKQLQELSHTWK